MASGFGTHLTPEQLVDAAEGVPVASVDVHLGRCEACRARVSELRSTMASVANLSAPVPEPSPLFWEGFQQRVVDAAVEERQRESALTRVVRSLQPSYLVPATAALAVAVAVLVTHTNIRMPRSNGSTQASLPGVDGGAAPPRELLRDSMDDDPSLALIADLANDVDWGAADAASLAPNGSADHAVSHMDARDLQELQRLLRAELGT